MDLSQLLPSFGGVAFTLIAFIVALSIIVAIHEYGHYIVGRWTGIHPEVFSLGFGPVLWSRVDRRGTRWQVAALPFGGYVKFLGDANAASVGSAEVAAAEARRTMLGAPLWARALTVAAGPIFNFVLSFLIFALIFFFQGQPADPARVAEVEALPSAVDSGLMPGDRLLAIEGRNIGSVEAMYNIFAGLEATPEITYTVDRKGAEIDVSGSWPYPPIALGVTPSSAAFDAGLEVGDVILSVDGDPIYAFEQLIEKVTASAGAPLALEVWRAGEVLDFTMEARRQDLPLPEGGFTTRWLIGISGGLHFDLVTERPGVFEAMGMGVDQVWYIIRSSLSGLWHMITGAISTCNLSGPVGIAETSGAMASQGGTNFIWFVAILSTAVGLLNLFPVPVLDGGHLVFHAYEAVARKPPSEAALRVLMSLGIGLIGTLMLFAIANDLFLCP